MSCVSNMAIMSSHVHQCINFTSDSKSVTGNGLIQRHRLPIVRHGNFSRPIQFFFVYFGNFSLRMRSFDHTTTSRLKSNVIFEFSAAIFLYKYGNFRRATLFSATFGEDNVCTNL